MEPSIVDLNREIVLNDYQSATKNNKEKFKTNDVKASEEYIFPNQKEDATIICNKFYNTSTRVISIVKRTKVGMDGLMIEIAKNMTTHPDNDFVLHRSNIFFITAMSNISWEDDMKDKMPSCFKDNVYHHGKLQKLKTKLKNIKNAIIINDEIDTGDKEGQKLHIRLKESGILDMKYMEENNIRFVFVSATMINELHDLYKWGDKHFIYHMTIPDNYIGHKEFLELGIIQEYYPINDDESADKWVQEDILQNYGSDYRVHIIRTDKKNIDFIFNACIRNNIDFKNHTSDDRISYKELTDIFNNISNHLVIAVKGFYRRANLIPNVWKKKIGATHERYVKIYDTNVQVQGLPGRMSGYWKDDISDLGHKTGPHRTSIAAINEYEEFYKNPLGKIKYSTRGSKNLFVNTKHIKNLEPINQVEEPQPIIKRKAPVELKEPVINKFKTQEEAKEYYNKNLKAKMNGRGPNKIKPNNDDYYEANIRGNKKVYSCEEIYKNRRCNIENGAGYGFRPCYRDTNDKKTLEWWFIHY
tara:strand:- start:755 stop:2338 length:1584 start_codon:yes stop_codon:yes gene_type:complete